MKPTIPNIVFILIIAILTVFLTFLTTKGGLTDNRHSKLWEKLTQQGKYVISLLVFIAITLIAQEVNNQNSNKNKDFLLKKEQENRDSIITTRVNIGVESSSKRLFENLSKAFSSQNLKIDTLKNIIKVVRDSIKTSVINNYAQDDPMLLIDSDGVFLKKTKDLVSEYGISFTSAKAGSSNFNIQTHILVYYSNEIFELWQANFFQKHLKIAKDIKWNTGFTVQSTKTVTKMYIDLKGTYKSFDESKEYSIDNLYRYNVTENNCSVIYGSEYDKIKSVIKHYPAKLMPSKEQ